MNEPHDISICDIGPPCFVCFESMCEEVVEPNDITFVCLLSACSHAGLVDEGMHLYASMLRDYMISAKSEHYTCMIDLLGCAGHLQEAENIIKAMPCTPSVLHGRLCLVLAEFMVIWRWQNVLLNEFLKWSRKMPLVMYCCQTSTLLLATGISVRMLKGRERKKVQRNSQVAPGLK